MVMKEEKQYIQKQYKKGNKLSRGRYLSRKTAHLLWRILLAAHVNSAGIEGCSFER